MRLPEKRKEGSPPEVAELFKPLADFLKPLAELEHSAYETFVKNPAEAMGVPPPPEIPGPATVVTKLAEGVSPIEAVIPTEGEKEGESPRERKKEKGKEKRRWGL